MADNALFPPAWQPELWLAAVCLLQAALTILLKQQNRFIMPFINLIGAAVYLLLLVRVPATTWAPMLQRTNLVSAIQALAVLAYGLTNLFHLLEDEEEAPQEPEYFLALSGIGLGIAVLPAARHLLLVWLAIEVISLSSYLATGLSHGRRQASAAIKYMLYGAAASAMMIYGMTWLYGMTGTLSLIPDSSGQVPFLNELQQANPVVVVMALLLVMMGLLFKLGAFPMHLWVPDVYDTAPLPLVALLSVGPKLSALGAVLLLLHSTAQVQPFVQQAIAIMALATITAGNVLALGQTRVRRLFAYSGVAQIGFLLAALVPGSLAAVEAGLFYAVIYLFANYGFIWLLMMPRNEPQLVTDLAGTGQRSTLYGSLWALNLLSLIGLPPAAGFFAKLLLFGQLYDFAAGSGFAAAALLLGGAAINAAIAIYYYLLIPWQQWLRPLNGSFSLRSNRWGIALMLTIPALWFFLMPNAVQSLVQGWLDAGH